MRALNKCGFSLVEMAVGLGILGVTVTATANFFLGQVHANNTAQFQAQQQEISIAVIQMLSDPLNCQCLFGGGTTTFPAGGTATLTGYTPPTQLGQFTSCATAPDPFLSNTGVDSIVLNSATLANITGAGTDYSGHLLVNMSTTKSVMGLSTVTLDFPVALSVTGTGPVTFQSCQNSGNSIPASMPRIFSTACRHGLSCDAQAVVLCSSMMGGSPYCLQTVYKSMCNAATKNIGVNGYTCTAGLCADGTMNNTTGDSQELP